METPWCAAGPHLLAVQLTLTAESAGQTENALNPHWSVGLQTTRHCQAQNGLAGSTQKENTIRLHSSCVLQEFYMRTFVCPEGILPHMQSKSNSALHAL